MTLDEIGKLLLTQDNRITADPIFMVQEEVRTWGIDIDFDPQQAWVDQTTGDYLHANEEESAKLKQLSDLGDETRLGSEEDGWIYYKLTGYVDHWQNVQPFFTEKAADEYIQRQSHNHSGKLRTYVESGHLNPEWKLIREFLMLRAKEELR